jgi:hypothetical protein
MCSYHRQPLLLRPAGGLSAGGVPMTSFDELQQELPAAWKAAQPESATDHVLVVLPSHSGLSESVLSHYGPRIPALEQRYLVAHLLLYRNPHSEMVFLCSQTPDPAVLDYYASLLPDDGAAPVRPRFHCVAVEEDAPKSLSAKFLGRPDLIGQVRDLVGDRPAYVQGWNVTELEVQAALALGMPLYGTAPQLLHFGHKSEGRRMFRAAGVPVPCGREDVRTVEDVLAAIEEIR